MGPTLPQPWKLCSVVGGTLSLTIQAQIPIFRMRIFSFLCTLIPEKKFHTQMRTFILRVQY